MTKMPRQKLKYLEKVKGSYDEIKSILSKYEVRLVRPSMVGWGQVCFIASLNTLVHGVHIYNIMNTQQTYENIFS